MIAVYDNKTVIVWANDDQWSQITTEVNL